MISKGMLALVTGMTFASVAHAADAPAPATAATPATSAEKTAPAISLIPGAYAKFEMRHTALRYETGDSVDKDRLNLAARPTLGSTFFDGRIDTAFTWIFQKSNSEGFAKRADLFNDTFLTVVDAGNGGTIKLEGYSISGTKSHFYNTDLSVNYESPDTWEIPVAANKVGLYVINQLGTSLTPASDTGEVPVKRSSDRSGADLGLTGAGQDSVKQRTPTSWNVFYTKVYVKPALVTGLTLSVGSELDTVWQPKYTEALDHDSIQQDGYHLGKSTITKYAVSYKVNDKITILNQLRQYGNGFYEARLDSAQANAIGVNYRWENRLVMEATLF